MPEKHSHIHLFSPDYISRQIRIGDLLLGGNNPVRIQSMTNTATSDIPSTVDQVIKLADAGCDIVRLAVQNRKEAGCLPVIQKELKRSGINIPLVADVHFNPNIAEIAARYVDKVRINPGNYVDRRWNKIHYSEKDNQMAVEKISNRLTPLLKICKQEGTALRIGINHGSLSERILVRYGNTPEGMVQSAMEFVRICHREGFDNVTLSLKASHVPTMIEANKLLVKKLMSEGLNYPLHLGVTEAGSGEEARVKSAAGIGSLLALGIGDTIRVSLTEDPASEIPVAKKLVNYYGRNKSTLKTLSDHVIIYKLLTAGTWKKLTGEKFPVATSLKTGKADLWVEQKGQLTATGTNSKIRIKEIAKNKPDENSLIQLSYPGLPVDELMIRAAVDFTLLAGQPHTTTTALWIDNGEEDTVESSLKILQALDKRLTKAEFVACPSCGRTCFDLIRKLNEIKMKTSHLKGLKIAVMGCIVNGPGEMADADYGYVGSRKGRVTLYRNGTALLKNIDENSAVHALESLIRKNGDWRESE